jgi:hypothetical protein
VKYRGHLEELGVGEWKISQQILKKCLEVVLAGLLTVGIARIDSSVLGQ